MRICPVPECPGQVFNDCEFCPDHQRLVAELGRWLTGLPRHFGTKTSPAVQFAVSFDEARAAWEEAMRAAPTSPRERFGSPKNPPRDKLL
jgi:hypothetical protein